MYRLKKDRVGVHEGRVALLQRGSVAIEGDPRILGTPGQTQPCELTIGEVPCEQRLFLKLIAASGRRVTIRGDDFWTPPAPAPDVWSWSGSGDLSGSGTYTATFAGGR